MLFISFLFYLIIFFFFGGGGAKDRRGQFKKEEFKKMYLNRVSLYPEKKVSSQVPWERKLLSPPVLLKKTYPDLDLPCKTASTVFVLFSLL